MDSISHSFLNDFHKVDGILKKVYYLWTDECLDKILLEFDSGSLLFEADPDFDTLSLRYLASAHLSDRANYVVVDSDRWNRFLNKRFAWGWITVNQQGYLDGVLLSFETIVPDLLLSTIASSITVSLVSRTAEDEYKARLDGN